MISSRIHPPISGVKIIPIPLDPIRPGRCAYVIEVPQSHTVHQAFDRRYYRRRNFKAEPMEDYEIREGISRGLNPVLIPFFELKFIRSREFGDERQLIVHLRNDGNVRVRDFMFEIDLRSDMVSDTFSVGRDLRNAIDLQISDIKVDGNAYKKLRIKLIGGLDIIFPQETIELAATGFRVILYVRTDRNHPSSQVYWRIYADNTRPRSGNLPVHEIPHVS